MSSQFKKRFSQPLPKFPGSFLVKYIVGLYLFFVLFSHFAINPLAKKLVPWIAEKNLASQASVEQVKFDPFRLKTTIDGFQLATLKGEQLFNFKQLIVDFELSGIFNRNWKFKKVGIFDPNFNLAIGPDGVLNWDGLIDKLSENEAPPSNSIQRMSFDSIVISKGNVKYVDANRIKPLKAELTPINFVLKDFSTLPKDRGEYTISAKFSEHGGSLKWKGDLAVNPVASKGKLILEDINLPELLRLVKESDLPFKATDGRIQTSFIYDFSMPKSSPKLLLNNVAIALNDIAAQLSQGGDVSIKQVGISTSQLDFFNNISAELHTKQLDFTLADFQLNQGEDTTIILKETNASMPQLDIQLQEVLDLKFEDLNIKLADLNISKGEVSLLSLPSIDVNQISLDLVENKAIVNQIVIPKGMVSATKNQQGLMNWQQAFAPPKKTKQEIDIKEPALIETNIKVEENVAVTIEKPALNEPAKSLMEFEINDIQLSHWALKIEDQSFKQPLLVNTQDFNLSLAVNSSAGELIIDNLQSQLLALTVNSTRNKSKSIKPAVSIQKIKLSEGQVDLSKEIITAESLLISGLNTSVVRDSGGAINWGAILAPIATSKVAATKATKEKAIGAQSWQVKLSTLVMDNASINIVDKINKAPVLLDIKKAKLEVKNVSLDMQKPLPISASFQVKQGGKFTTNGKFTPSPFKLNTGLKLAELSLKPFAPYVNQFALLKLNDGAVDVKGELSLKQNKALALNFNGGFSVKKLALVEEANDAAFLSWDRLSSDSLSLALLPNKVEMDNLTFNKLEGKFIINEDKSNNIARIMRQQTADEDNAVAVEKVVTNTTTAETEAAFPVIIHTLKFNDAALEFADLSLRLPFGTDIHALNGVVNNISTKKDVISKVSLDGRVNEYGSAKINGEVQPFDATNFTDLSLDFVNLEMSGLSPYSGTFAGRKIDSGKMTVNLEYKIKQRKLEGENQFLINKLKLGEKIDSEGAADLPLDLAIAILEDNDGLIDLGLPISGSLDDPEFSYGSIVWKAIRNVLTKIVTAPFSALSKMFGSGDIKFDTITFAAGESSLSPPELEKVVKLSKGLAKRKKLALGITPVYDPSSDTKAIQEATYRQQIANEMGVKIPEGQVAGLVDLANPKTQEAIDDLYNELTKKGFFKKLKTKFKKPEEGHFEKAEKALIDSVEVTEKDLQALAVSRGEAIKQVLLGNGIAAQGIQLYAPKKELGEDGKVKTNFTLEVNKGVAKQDAINSDTQAATPIKTNLKGSEPEALKNNTK